MADKLQEITDKLKEIKQLVLDLPAELRIAGNQINVTTLDEVSDCLGLIRAGEFRVGNGKEPGNGFTGMRMRYPSMTYENNYWNFVGVNEDDIQFGVDATTGRLYAADGRVLIDKTSIGIAGLLYGLQHEATYGTETRKAWLGMWLPSGSSTPTWGIIFSGGTEGSNVIENGDAEHGDLSHWTQSGTSFSASTDSPYAGTYCFKCDNITSGTKTFTTDRYTCVAGTTYNFSIYTKDTSSSAPSSPAR